MGSFFHPYKSISDAIFHDFHEEAYNLSPCMHIGRSKLGRELNCLLLPPPLPLLTLSPSLYPYYPTSYFDTSFHDFHGVLKIFHHVCTLQRANLVEGSLGYTLSYSYPINSSLFLTSDLCCIQGSWLRLVIATIGYNPNLF
eukprot:Phypoly_transcript_09280.p1 GENE.Phypoly_transcript_09280~~Phypoly_transcript_09280.p1  ORF type:complete len:141 (-),score=9.19 Phypoly_transcript_09280:619-1041(-)